MTEWKYHTPERDGHAPDDWVEGCEWQWLPYEKAGWRSANERADWLHGLEYRYRPLQDATYEPDLLDTRRPCHEYADFLTQQEARVVRLIRKSREAGRAFDEAGL